MAKRKIFDELMEGLAAMKASHEGKIILRSYRVDFQLHPQDQAVPQ